MVENMCRACLLSEDSDIHFQNMKIPFIENGSTIGIIFSKISTVHHDPNDGFPQKICQTCFEELTSSYEFQKKCIQSDIEIRNMMENLPEFTETKKREIKIETEEFEIEAEIDDWNIYNDDEKSRNVCDNLTEPIELREPLIERPNPKSKRKSSYKCETCNKVFDRNSSLNRHLKSHKPGEVFNFACKICYCKFTKEKNLTKHLEYKHSDSNKSWFPCPHCPRKFIKKVSRSVHMLCHKGGSTCNTDENMEKYDNSLDEQHKEEVPTQELKLFQIDVKPLQVVSNVINTNDSVENKMKIIKAENETNAHLINNKEDTNYDDDSDEAELPNPKNKRKAVHECEVCQKTFDRKYRLDRHLNIHNPDGRPFECPVCKKRFASEQNLTRHAIMHTAVADCIKQNDKPKAHRCLYCPRKFAKKQSLASHMGVHKANIPPPETQERHFKCQFCFKAFFKITSLTRHLNTHDDEKDFQCNLCDKNFTLRSQLVDHMNWHKGINPFQCEICTKSFNRSCTLKDHIRTHSGEKPFLCSECGKSFNNSSNFRQHRLRHSGDKPFKCTECPNSFTSKGGLKSHMKTHAKLKTNVCDTCGTAFTKRYSLKKHKRILTGEKPYECSKCHMKYGMETLRYTSRFGINQN